MPALAFIWIAIRCCSSLIWHKTNLIKGKADISLQYCRKWPAEGCCECLRAGAVAEEGNSWARTEVSGGISFRVYQILEVPMLLGCSPEPPRAKRNSAAPAHLSCPSATSVLDSRMPLPRKTFTRGYFNQLVMVMLKISHSYQRATNTYCLIQNRGICQTLPFLNHNYQVWIMLCCKGAPRIILN